jgi:hypothetical protein
MRNMILNMTMSVDGFVAGPDVELAWMATAPDAELTADIIALLRSADAAFLGYPTAAGMINYWAGIADDPRHPSSSAPASASTEPRRRDHADRISARSTFRQHHRRDVSRCGGV